MGREVGAPGLSTKCGINLFALSQDLSKIVLSSKVKPAHSRRLSFLCEGALEHPEELTDRCCLSALAGLSKYLPSLGACSIIVLRFCYVKFNSKLFAPRSRTRK